MEVLFAVSCLFLGQLIALIVTFKWLQVNTIHIRMVFLGNLLSALAGIVLLRDLQIFRWDQMILVEQVILFIPVLVGTTLLTGLYYYLGKILLEAKIQKNHSPRRF